jgi:hypothetical protein
MRWAGEAGRHEARQTAGGGGPASSPAPAAGHLPATSQLQVPRPAYIINNDQQSQPVLGSRIRMFWASQIRIH